MRCRAGGGCCECPVARWALPGNTNTLLVLAAGVDIFVKQHTNKKVHSLLLRVQRDVCVYILEM
jgi:hypothetical protein